MEQPPNHTGCLPAILAAFGAGILTFGEGVGILDDSKLSGYIYGSSSALFLAAIVAFASERLIQNNH